MADAKQTIHDAICDALPEWIKWRRLPRWRGDYAEAHAHAATKAVLEALDKAGFEIVVKQPGEKKCCCGDPRSQTETAGPCSSCFIGVHESCENPVWVDEQGHIIRRTAVLSG